MSFASIFLALGGVVAFSLPVKSQDLLVAPGVEQADELDSSFLNPQSPKQPGLFDRLGIGSYGELHLNQGDKNEIDFHRLVLFLNYRYTDRIRFVSELELEHALSGDGKPGELELEQAYLEFAFDHGWVLRAGQYLLPLGILNEVHEPETFYGVERNGIETQIIPTTWWEAGLLVSKETESGLGFDFGIHSGLSIATNGSQAFNIRSGRQKVAKADASNYAASARIRYNALAGLSLTAFANFQEDVTPSSVEQNTATLLGASALYQRGGLQLRALVADWKIRGSAFQVSGSDHQSGYYFEPSYRWYRGDRSVGIFARIGAYDFYKGQMQQADEISLGVNFWPHENIVVKADYTEVKFQGSQDHQTYNFGIGYSF